MKSTTSLTLVAAGAILAFAISRSPSFLNLQVVGWVLIATGGIGAIIPRRGYGWLRRSLVVPNDEEAETAPAGRKRPQFNRILVPGGVIDSRRGMQSTGGQVQRKTIED